MKFVIFSTPQLIQSFISYRKKNRNRQLENAFYVNLCQIRTNTTNSLGKKTDKNTNFCTFCKQSKLMSWLTKLKQNKKLLVKTCIDLKKNVIFGVQNSIQKNGKIYRYSKQKTQKHYQKEKS